MAGIDPAKAGGPQSMNYTRAQLDAILDKAAPAGWQMALHANGDLAIDLALDAYEAALQRHHLVGTDHRWRIEHLGAGTRRSQLCLEAGWLKHRPRHGIHVCSHCQ
jgi:predicted amidohydrolase YtcJ